jgi:hypothetical protein
MRNYPAAVTDESQRIVQFVMWKTDDISSWTTEVVCNIHTGYQLPTIVTFNTLFVPYSHRRQNNQGSTRRMEAALLLVICQMSSAKSDPASSRDQGAEERDIQKRHSA